MKLLNLCDTFHNFVRNYIFELHSKKHSELTFQGIQEISQKSSLPVMSDMRHNGFERFQYVIK